MKIRNLLIIFVAWLISLLAVPTAQANQLCKWFGYCVYESPAFRITVIDGETGRPLADVHAMAEWVQYGYHGRGGPLIIQESISGADGVLQFSAWGPVHGSSAGLVLNEDPVVSLFKPGHKVLKINNAPGTDERARVRGFTQDGATFKLEPFRGTVADWTKELRIAANPSGVGLPVSAPADLRAVYMNRTQRVKAEAEKLPANLREVKQLLDYLSRDIKFLQGDSRP